MPLDCIHVKGAREHNLKNIEVKIPRDRFVVITGLSGSGKSTLAFDTIYAEGQRRYVESLSAYARQFLEQMDKPDVDFIDGLSPAISIEQKATSRNPRSTVGTVTEIYDYLRLLFARIGTQHCHNCGKPISSQTASQMVDRVKELKEGTRITILSPIVHQRKGEHKKELERLKKAGFVRVRINGETKDLSEEITLDKKKKHTVDVIIDRLIVKSTIGNRLADSIELALKEGEGLVKIDVAGGENFLLSERSACPDCGISFSELTPQMFSFNSPTGACPECTGLGTKLYFDRDLIVPNRNLSLRDGAIVPWNTKNAVYYTQLYQSLAKHYKFDIYTPFKELPKKLQDVIFHGSGEEEVAFVFDHHGAREAYKKPFIGVMAQLERRYNQTESDWVREDMERFMNIRPCPVCDGSRLKKESLFVKIHGLSIQDITSLSVKESVKLFSELPLTEREKHISTRILKEVRDRLSFLSGVGLNYLALDRTSATLSGGEAQRIRLATQIGSSLMGVLYVLDEPSIGLHQRDNHKLIETLTKLRDLGNTVLVVEHDRDTIMASDYIVDMGPGAGSEGGEIVATGTPEEILKQKNSLTGQYISGVKCIPVPLSRRISDGRKLVIKNAHEHNLKNIDVSIPLGVFTCVTGVSGSGKSTLINDTLYNGLSQRLYHSKITAGKMDDLLGAEHLDKVVNIDQSPIGRTPRSNPATYTGVFTFIRDLFTELPAAKTRGYKAGRFSFNVKGGRCETCEGDGMIRIEMQFLPDVYVPCEVCHGKRFNRETLEVQYKGASISDVLDMTIYQSFEFFKNIPSIHNKLQTLLDVGLGYIKLGQPANTLSGGEAQRIKLSRELSKRATGRTLYILDEPTIGLHFADIQKLLDVLNRLVDAGNTILVIEHNMDVVKSADYLIDLGPEGGDGGGEIVAFGTPEGLTKCEKSYTGAYLKEYL